MKLATMTLVTMVMVIVLAGSAALAGVISIVSAFKERNRLRREVALMHRKADEISGSYLENRNFLEGQMRKARAEANAARWECDATVADYAERIAKLEKQLAQKTELLKAADETIHRLNEKKTARGAGTPKAAEA